jgi:hypothetical protein
MDNGVAMEVGLAEVVMPVTMDLIALVVADPPANPEPQETEVKAVLAGLAVMGVQYLRAALL